MKAILTILFSLWASVISAQQILTPQGGAICNQMSMMTTCAGPTPESNVTIMPLDKLNTYTITPMTPTQPAQRFEPLAPLPFEDDDAGVSKKRSGRPSLPRDATCPRSWQMMGRC